MIIPHHNSIFVHIPKTGGTSVQRSLSRHAERGGNGDIEGEDKRGLSLSEAKRLVAERRASRRKRRGTLSHPPPPDFHERTAARREQAPDRTDALRKRLGGLAFHRSLEQYQLICPKPLETYYVFSIMRNPWDREYSFYNFFVGPRRSGRDRPSWKPGKTPSFKRYLKDLNSATDDAGAFDMNSLSAAWEDRLAFPTAEGLRRTSVVLRHPFLFWRQQVDYISINNEVKVDYLIKFENLQEGYEEVCRHLQHPPRTLPHLRNQRLESYRSAYDQETIDIIYRIRDRDIAFGSFSPF